MTPATHATWARAGYIYMVVLVLVGTVLSLAPFVLPPEAHRAFARPLYGDLYVDEQFARLAERPLTEAAHRIAGVVFMLAGWTQFTPKIRARRWAVHRWLGRIFLALSVLVAATGIVFAVAVPFGGFALTALVLVYAPIMLWSSWRAFTCARQRQIARHREWVLRCFSIGLGVVTLRLIFVILAAFGPAGDRELLAVSGWIAWTGHTLAVEWWLLAGRRRPAARARAAATPA